MSGAQVNTQHMRAVKTAILSACVAVDWTFFLVSQHMMSYRLTGRDFYKVIKKHLLIVDNFLLQCTLRDIDIRQIEVHFQL